MYDYSATDLNYHHAANLPDPTRFPMHLHDRFEILCIVHGSGTCTIEGVEYPLQDSSIFLIRPSEVHKLTPDPNVLYERIQIHFSQELIHAVDPQGFLLEAFNNHNLGYDLLYSFAEFTGIDVGLLLKDMQSESDDPDIRRMKILSSLFFLLEKLRTAFYDRNIKKKEYSKTNTILQYINNNLFKNITLDEIASDLYISRSQLTRSFKKATGSTINEYITMKRLILARQMIMRGEPATNACYHCGFRDYSSFFRAYKKFFGVAPSNRQDQPLIDKAY